MLCSDDSSEFHPPIRAESIWQALVRCPCRGFPLIFVIWVLLKSSLLGVHAVGLPFDGPVLVVLWNPWVFIGVLTVMFFCHIYKPLWYCRYQSRWLLMKNLSSQTLTMQAVLTRWWCCWALLWWSTSCSKNYWNLHCSPPLLYCGKTDWKCWEILQENKGIELVLRCSHVQWDDDFVHVSWTTRESLSIYWRTETSEDCSWYLQL
jgi:hypothetical protein